MRISNVLRSKGATVVTVQPDETVKGLIALLAEHRIGAMVVSTDGKTLEGIVSERDVVLALHTEGPDLLERKVSDIMTVDVHTCGPQVPIDDLMRTMTDERVRHIPVVVDGELRGIVSIGDVVKHKLGELQFERDQLAGYVATQQ